MKKTYVILITVMLAIVACGCESAMEKREASLSELRDEVLVGGDENVTITLNSGNRENPYVIDGLPSSERTDFSVITVDGSFNGEEELGYVLRVGEQSYEGKLQKHPFKNSYSTELAVRSPSTVTITLSGANFAGNYELKSVITDATISANEALEIAEERLKNSIKRMTVDGRLNAEVYVRLLKNPISASGGYFWYVAYVPEKYSVYAVLIHSETREIAAIRE